MQPALSETRSSPRHVLGLALAAAALLAAFSAGWWAKLIPLDKDSSGHPSIVADFVPEALSLKLLTGATPGQITAISYRQDRNCRSYDKTNIAAWLRDREELAADFAAKFAHQFSFLVGEKNSVLRFITRSNFSVGSVFANEQGLTILGIDPDAARELQKLGVERLGQGGWRETTRNFSARIKEYRLQFGYCSLSGHWCSGLRACDGVSWLTEPRGF